MTVTKIIMPLIAGCIILSSTPSWAAWTRIMCLQRCTDDSCKIATKLEECKKECPESIIQACLKNAPKTGEIPQQQRISPPQQRISPPQQRVSPPQERVSPPQQRVSPPQQRISPHQQRVSPPIQRAQLPTTKMAPSAPLPRTLTQDRPQPLDSSAMATKIPDTSHYTFTFGHDNQEQNIITFTNSISVVGNYVPDDVVRIALSDPQDKTEVAPWLKKVLNVTSAKIINLKRQAVGESMSSQNYQLTLDNNQSYFIKVEASSNRIGKQGKADKMVSDLMEDGTFGNLIFIKQLASIIVHFNEDKRNEIIIFPQLQFKQFGAASSQAWYALGKGIALFKKASDMRYVLPDFHRKNIGISPDEKTIYILDYQLLYKAPPIQDSNRYCFDIRRIMMDGNPEQGAKFSQGFLSVFSQDKIQTLKDDCSLK